VLQKIEARYKGLVEFVGDVRNELKKVSWPSRGEVYGTTIVVIFAVFFFGFYLFFVDLTLQNTIKKVYDYFQN